MIFSIISEYDIFYEPVNCVSSLRSSNPYDYIRQGYYLDNASMFGGKNNVDFNCHFSGNRTSTDVDISDI